MKTTHVTLLVPIFPNPVQPYVAESIVALKHKGICCTIIAERGEPLDKAPAPVLENNLMQDTIYITSSISKLVSAFFKLFCKINYRKRAFKLIRSKPWCLFGLKYSIKAINRLSHLPETIGVIHSHSVFCTYDYLFLKTIFNIPILTTYHGVLPESVNRLADNKLHLVFNYGDRFIVNTESAKQLFCSQGAPADKCAIIPQGTNLDRYTFESHNLSTKDNFILLTVGRLSPEKGHKVAIHALAKVIKQLDNVSYTIVGHGPEQQNLLELIEELQLQKHVNLVDHASGDKLLAYFHQSDLYIQPSHCETQGVVIQEAQACGLPVICSNAGGIPEVVIGNENALLFNDNDASQLANIIIQLIQSPETYLNFSNKGRTHVEQNFDVNIIADRLIALYDEHDISH